MLKEQFIPPGDRAEFPAKYDHLQTCEATHRDTNLGPSQAQAKHTSDGSVALSSKATCTGLPIATDNRSERKTVLRKLCRRMPLHCASVCGTIGTPSR